MNLEIEVPSGKVPARAGWCRAGSVFLWSAYCVCSVAAAGFGLYAFSLPGLDPALLIASAGIGSAVTLIWAIEFGLALGRKARISQLEMTRWVAFPLVAAVCLAMVALDVPRTIRFNLSRAELEAAAAKTNGDSLPGWIGLMPVDGIWRDPDGTTTFWLTGDQSLIGYPCGLTYAPRGEPPQHGGQLGRKIADGWWVWCEND
jgi:hypothetical protein